jgi:hypothetical protein
MGLSTTLSVVLFCHWGDYKKHMLIYIYIHICVYLYFYLSGVENLCHYTLSPSGPTHRELGCWGLGWTCGASPPGGIPENYHDGVLFGERSCVAPIGSFIRLGAPGEGT